MTTRIFTHAALLIAVAATPSFAQTRPDVAMPGGDPYSSTAIVDVVAGTSFIRLANLRDEAVTNHVEVYGLETKELLANYTVDVPAKASVQFRPDTMIQTFAPVNYDQPVVVYVENGRDKQLWQHIKYNAERGVYENASVCAYSPHPDYIPPHNVALNVAAAEVSLTPSIVTVHNFTDVAGRFEARIYDAGSGKLIGAMPVNLGPRESYRASGGWYVQQSGGFLTQRPGDERAEEPQINIEYVPVAPDSGARVVVSHAAYNYFLGSNVNFSVACPLTGAEIQLPAPGEPQ